MTDLLRRLFEDAGDGRFTYEETRELAAHDDVAVRRTLAHRTDVAPEVLYYLAEDDDAEVRRTIAGNTSTPARAYLLLTGDSDETVRLTLAQRIAALAPGLSDDEKDRVGQNVHEALARLARDQIPKVRALLSDALKNIANAPASAVNHLARDAEIAVAAPVLTFSPVLTDEDLLDLIQDGPASDRLAAIARRPGGLTERVTDAIVDTADLSAIADMLANQGAQIREETLDALIDRAPSVPEWHAPLVGRPRLHPAAARRLAVFVSDTLVQALMLRQDLSPDAAEAVSTEMHRRIARQSPAEELIDFGPDWRRSLQELHVRVLDTLKAGTSGETELRAAMAANNRTLGIAVLSAMAGVAPMALAVAVQALSAKGLVAMAWKAGLPASLLPDLQRWLGAIPPHEILTSSPESDGYPMEEAEMEWQVEMFCDLEAADEAP
ncbi:DUF2336 domain-containing protein [uncultured Rhodospira sp.]|uniref:DUF2336 domain-containing protein n=1 Tax=uncultured Rhodospira sp. TaxID=1936189 RepID=UPI00263428A6|nr:DUF2336 domain-containing protein [uncultured Rhodospira sp.]